VAKGVIWGAMALTEGLRGLAAETGEQLSDLYAEARHDYEKKQSVNVEAMAASTSRIITPESPAPTSAPQLVTPEGKPVTEL
jgi:hypothetical protein